MDIGSRIKKVEEAVLAVYKTHNPSYNPRQRAMLGKHITRVSTILKRAGLPTDLRDKLVLDAACGTGEYTIVYGALGAKVTGIDFNETSVTMASQLFDVNGFAGRFIASSLFELEFAPASFDVVSSLGTLHHTADPGLAFHVLARLVKPHGYFVLQIADPYGCWLRRFRRWAVIALAGEDSERRAWWSELL